MEMRLLLQIPKTQCFQILNTNIKKTLGTGCLNVLVRDSDPDTLILVVKDVWSYAINKEFPSLVLCTFYLSFVLYFANAQYFLFWDFF